MLLPISLLASTAFSVGIYNLIEYPVNSIILGMDHLNILLMHTMNVACLYQTLYKLTVFLLSAAFSFFWIICFTAFSGLFLPFCKISLGFTPHGLASNTCMVRADFFATLRILAVFVLPKPKVLLHNILQNWVWSVIETLLSMMSIEGSGGRPT